MREITCEGGMRWRLEALTVPSTDEEAGADGAEAPPVALLACVTCEGDPRHVTIRAPLDAWLDMSGADLCRLIAEAEATDA